MNPINNCTPEEEEQINKVLKIVSVIWKENPELRTDKDHYSNKREEPLV